MSNPLLAEPESTHAIPKAIWTFPDDDDDDDADEDDEDEGISASRHDRWFSLSDFGSPEWWSRH